MSETPDAGIDVLLRGQRTFPPSRAFTERAIIANASVYDEADADLSGFWLRQGTSALT